MKAIDENIKRSLKEAAVDYGSVLGLSRRMGVSHSTVLFWGSGKTRNMDGDVWRYKVYPVLEPYLKRGGAGRVREEAAGGFSPWTDSSGTPLLHTVPVIGRAQAAGFDPALEPFDAYARGCGGGTAHFASEPKSGYFALKMDGGGMEQDFPEGTLILVAGGEFVKSGDVVVARIRGGGDVVVKRYSRDGDCLRLESLNRDGINFEWDRKADRGYLEWIYPVVEAKVDFRAKGRRRGAVGKRRTACAREMEDEESPASEELEIFWSGEK